MAVGFGAVLLTFGLPARREFDGDRQQARIEPAASASQPAPRVTHRVPEPILRPAPHSGIAASAAACSARKRKRRSRAH